MDSLVIQGFRCFGKRVEVPLRPLTLLVGENSTGKSTLLGAVRLAWDLAAGNRLNFREAPFDYGHVSDFAHDGGRGEGAEIRLGFSGAGSPRRGHDNLAVEFVLGERDGEIVTSAVILRHESFKLRVEESGDGEFKVTTESEHGETTSEATTSPWFLQQGIFHLSYLTLDILQELTKRPQRTSVTNFLDAIRFSYIQRPQMRPYANAPVRARPERVYTPGQLTAEPEGSHAPVVLAKLLARGNGEAQRARELIEGYGQASGLFSALEVKQFGDGKSGDPFQVMFRIDGQAKARNAIDVGYGISQILPLLVDLASLETTTFLLQQPEVHLHPRAQAEVGSLLLRQAAAGKQMIVETHSDFILDRVCIDIHEGKANHKDVQILYFERTDGEVQVHLIGIDAAGNIQGAPPSYRSFFEREARRLWGG